MSKLDAQRAMREANYAARQQPGAPGPRRAAEAPVAPPVSPSAPKARAKKRPAGASPKSDPGTGTCGHRSMNGRTCTREAGHSEKSHRYG